MFEIVYTIVFLICFIGIFPVLIFYAIKENKEKKQMEKDYMSLIISIQDDLKFIRKEVEHVSNEKYEKV